MRIDMEWVKAAHNALKTSGFGIVDDEGNYPKAFKGYISSLGASIIQTGLFPALSIYENDNEASGTSAENNRAYLIYAIVCLLQELEIIKDKEKKFMLTHYLIDDRKTDWNRYIGKALVALKLAIRVYTPDDGRRDKRGLFDKLENEKDMVDCVMGIYSNKPNLGWIYYKDLYRDYGYCKSDDLIERKIRMICEAKFKHYEGFAEKMSDVFKNEDGYCSFTLVTTYPGLVIGTGLSHGIKSKDDIKTGMMFDYSTGLPYIPGSSVKGVLRSIFPDSDNDSTRISFVKEILSENGIKVYDSDIRKLCGNIRKLCGNLFETDNGVVFLDTFISAVNNNNGYFIGTDYITPHKNPLKNPVPIKILKVCPGVTFKFSFIIPDVVSLSEGMSLTRCEVMEMFKSILLYVGAGAKTNVGYGHFRDD
ncbi:type III-B CRISPR module RAMP protein Cmr6 [Xylanibacter muris]|uniref:CRISPR type III-B/RAMP module-associated protein Cmr5 n=1 Tax=Xylanibacter muris TaxID=2736290 RepID=A0ABX2AP19_9BACT|nr:type III-B CRISPR module RAMP protein Cmr6 [Xylanibacter muris]NPD92739.1 type III-B CRISPR module RAMP protein Cmr6 [Xylanibacter muris]